MTQSSPTKSDVTSIWWFAFGYFASYVPYSALTKAASSGWLGDKIKISGNELLPWSTLTSLIGMIVFMSAMGWWKYASRWTLFGRSLPRPGRLTFVSGVCTAAVIVTTTLAYTFEGISIVFMMLLMRGGVLVLAPLVDFVAKRHVRWFSWVGLLLSVGALIAAFLKDTGFNLTTVATIDVAVYLASYFVRLRFMSRLAKSTDNDARLRFFVEEQMVATPVVAVVLGALALIDHGQFMHEIRLGYTSVFDLGLFVHVVLIGLFSQGTGVFGGLILLDRQENTYCVPVNRSSSILAGVLATYSLAVIYSRPGPDSYELAGAGLIIAAILVLTIPSLFGKRNRAA